MSKPTVQHKRRRKPPVEPPAAAPRAYTIFVTRDSDPVTGELSPRVDAWFASPKRLVVGDRGALWWPPRGLDDRAGVWTLEVCRRHAKTVPDDDRQCLRIEGDAIRSEVAA
jgi:hypothetical protein